MPQATIAIIGAGFSGTLLSLHLLRRCPAATRVVLIERNSQFGRGQAYSTGNPSHLLNVPAGRMSAFRDRPGHFLEWLQRQAAGATPPTAGCFVPRSTFGAYVRHLLNEEISRADSADRLDLVRGDVLDLREEGAGLSLLLDRGRRVQADLAVLAIGNFPPELPPIPDAPALHGPFYRADPWAPDALSDLDPDAPVLLIGTGLTMVDAVISLLDQGHRGPVHAVSRRGLLPRRHAAPDGRPPAALEALPGSVVELTRFVRAEARRRLAEGGSWQPVVDSLRPFTQDVWQSLSLDDRRRFLRHLRPWWDVHRHRMAGPVADRIEAAREAGQLLVHTGRFLSLREVDGEVEAAFRRRRDLEVQRLRVARVVNCSGPGCDYDRIAHPLVRSLLGQGLVRPDPLRLGLDVTATCAVRDGRGAISRRLFAVGPVTKAAFWEMTAVPDLRRQCEFLAEHLAGVLGASPPPRPFFQREEALANIAFLNR